MNLIFRSLIRLIEFSIVVGLAGGLVDLTRSMGKEAVKAHKTGIVSLHELNAKLVGKPNLADKPHQFGFFEN
jgi:hypothetical protein